MESVTQLGYLGLSLSDINAWEHFATHTLGLQVSERGDDGSLFLRTDEYHHRFLVHPTGKDDLAYIGWEVKDEDALRAMAEQLTASGIEVKKGTQAEAEARRVVDLLTFYAVPQPPKRLNHFMLQAKTLDDVGATYYLCQDQGVPIARSLGRHTNDHMVSFYLRTPSGFEVEYGWGGRVVDDSTWQVQLHTAGSMWGHRPVSR